MNVSSRQQHVEADLVRIFGAWPGMNAVAAALLEALPGHAALLDREGTIVAVNSRWRRFGVSQSLSDPAAGVGTNYLAVCDAATGADAIDGRRVGDGIRAVLAGRLPRFAHMYPCYTPAEERWFELLARPLGTTSVMGALVMHLDATDRVAADDRAEAQHARFQALIEHGSDIVVLTDVQGVISYASPSIGAVLGRAPDDCVGSVIDGCLGHDDGTSMRAAFASGLAAPRTAIAVTIEACHVDGSSRVLQGHLTNLLGEPVVRAVVLNLRDVTEARALAREAEAHAQQFHAVFEHAGDAMALADDSSRYTAANPAAVELFGRPLEELLRLTGAEVTAAGIDHAAAWAAFLARGEMRGAYRLRRPDGSERDIEFTATAHVLPGRHLAVMRDVTERNWKTRMLQSAEQALDVSQRCVATLVAGNPLALGIVRERDGVVIEANAKFGTVTGVRREDLVGRPIGTLGLWRGPDPLEALPMRADAYDIETTLRTRTGESREVLVSVRRLPADAYDGPSAVVALLDVTERKRLEAQVQQSQKMEAIGRLAGGVAHDFNNLLTALIGFTELALRRPGLPSEARGDLEQVRRAADSATQLTSQLLAMSRRHGANARPLQVNDVVRHVEALMRRLVGERIEMDLTLGDGLPLVCADPSQIEQVLLNLLTNARDAMPDGGRLRVETGTGRVPARLADAAAALRTETCVTITVTDSGHGIDEDLRAHIFEPFYTTKPSGQGTGLGLAIVYGVVRQCGGCIDVASTPGEGSTFRVYLPPHAGDAVAAAPDTPAPAPGGAETILLVEDQEPVRVLARLILEQHGYHVHVATDGADALAIAEQLPSIDLLLTDVVMPRVTGPQLAAELGARRPGLRVLFMSGYVGEPSASGISVPPGAPLLRKPFAPSALLDAVRRRLDAEATPASETLVPER